MKKYLQWKKFCAIIFYRSSVAESIEFVGIAQWYPAVFVHTVHLNQQIMNGNWLSACGIHASVLWHARGRIKEVGNAHLRKQVWVLLWARHSGELLKSLKIYFWEIFLWSGSNANADYLCKIHMRRIKGLRYDRILNYRLIGGRNEAYN